MAVKKALVLYNGQPAQLQAGDTLDVQAETVTYTNADSVSIVICAPVYMSAAGSFKRAQANATGTKDVVGLVITSPSVAAAAQGTFTMDGLITATTAQWDAVTGQTGGLTATSRYYLDPSNPGKLTTTPPSTVGQYVAEIGIAFNTTDLKINILTPILL